MRSYPRHEGAWLSLRMSKAEAGVNITYMASQPENRVECLTILDGGKMLTGAREY